MAQRVLRQALTTGTKFTKVLRNQITNATRGDLEPIAVRSGPYSHAPLRQPVHPAALRRQVKNSGSARWYSSTHRAVRRFFSTDDPAAPRYVDRAAYLKSSVGSHAVWRSSGRAPFASTLRPNLTGGALPRTAGGYASGGAGRGGARYFSHTPAAPAQVVQNVSQAMRAFWVSGQRARFDGTDAHGRAAYKAISALEEDLARKLAVPALPKMAPGAFVDFSLNPTITALAPFVGLSTAVAASKAAVITLGTEGFLDVLSVDFARALKELSAIMNDLKRLAALGDLPVLLDQGEGASVLRVRFPGVDAETVDRLCADLGITRGLVGQDPGFDLAMGTYAALRFPFAPDTPESLLGSSAAEDMLTSPGGSLRSHQSWLSSDEDEDELRDVFADYDATGGANPWLASSPASSARGAVDVVAIEAEDGYASMSPPVPSSGEHMSQEFEGLEGIYRFLEECDRVQLR
ncbi:casein kinase 2 beta 2 subunit [Sporothrix brasiliensis 5110]|uniref:Casein kinase 2 beta 2 subunit n=1 Tax=Sporothrix brasiliensis 5110 TaxID=1398154 RepID=A0A0C2FF01_9PEZI|nr:casein kinase 2 beta 2 subunit [Sporothrix brasiliensis 5110]KIH89668.1 casein kinase 2 beta 2 subunit [Sporothrix brasiliensis 5110]